MDRFRKLCWFPKSRQLFRLSFKLHSCQYTQSITNNARTIHNQNPFFVYYVCLTLFDSRNSGKYIHKNENQRLISKINLKRFVSEITTEYLILYLWQTKNNKNYQAKPNTSHLSTVFGKHQKHKIIVCVFSLFCFENINDTETSDSLQTIHSLQLCQSILIATALTEL